MSVGLALVFAITLTLGFAAPVAADEEEWSAYDIPETGEDGDYFIDSTIDDSVGPIARDIDGYFWAYVEFGAGEDEIVKSLDTEGRSWEITMYSDADDGVEGDDVVAIVCSSEDADVVYAADADQVFKTEDSGDTWAEVSDISAATGWPATNGAVTCLTVGYASDEPHVYAGVVDTDSSAFGDVFHINDVAFGGTWEELDLDYDVYGIGASPDFDNDTLVVAIATDEAASYAATNRGADVGVWNTDTDLEQDDGGVYALTEASDALFPADFDEDDAFEYYVGVVGDANDADDLGGVYRVYGEADDEFDLLDDVIADIVSLDIVGDVGATYQLAGTSAADVWYSDDDGDSWEQASAEGIQPTGSAYAYVICGDDIADNGIGWAAVDGTDAAVSMTTDGGASWRGISLIDEALATVDGLALSPSFASPGYMFLLTDTNNSILRYDGSNWERVYEATQYGSAIDLVAVSPEIDSDDTVFLGLTSGPTIFFSEDNGDIFEETRNAPDDLVSLLIIDNETIIAGGVVGTTGTVWVTDIQGRRTWDEYEVATAAGDIVSLVANGDTLLAGDDESQIFISEDLGETWDEVGDLAAEVSSTGDAYACFDTDDPTTIYAASDDVIARFLDVGELDEDWEVFDTDVDADADNDFNDAVGILCEDGVVYAASDDAMVVDDAGAMMRCLNPLEDLDDVDLSEFEQVNAGLTATTDNFDSLDMTSGSIILWAYDISTATVWTYTDTLTVPVVLVGPADGSSSERTAYVTLAWTGLDNADSYEVLWDYDPDFIYLPTTSTGGETTYLSVDTSVDLGEIIYWKVRAEAPVLSRWSDVWTFTVALGVGQWNPFFGGVPEVPYNGATNVPLTPTFAWNAADWATGYEFELADNSDFTSPIISTTVTTTVTASDVELDYSTTYYWRVRAVSASSQSAWGVGTFTTLAEPAAPVEPGPVEPIVIPTPIPPAVLWTIVGIGAVLAIAVIVLIVRTRRVV